MKQEAISQAEAAKMLGISVSTLCRRRAEDEAANTYGLREPGGFKTEGGWVWRYRIEDVRTWLAKKARRNLVAACESASQGANR